MKKILITIFLFSGFLATAQVANVQSDSTAPKAAAKIVFEPGIETLLEKFKKHNYASAGLEGYRVQIFTSAGNEAREKAERSLADFNAVFPDVKAYLTYQQPNFKVRCGDFRSKSEARKLMKKISYQYPGSYIVRDVIKLD